MQLGLLPETESSCVVGREYMNFLKAFIDYT